MSEKDTKSPVNEQAPESGDDGDGPAESSALLGHFQHRFDPKNRITLPREYRARLGARGEKSVVLTNFLCDGARCLDGYVKSEWVTFEKKLRERSRFDPQLRKLETFYLSRAAECPVDSSGRILVPPHLRQYAGLDKDVVFASSLHGFRVWDKRVWDLVFAEAESALLENPALFRNVDL